MTPPAAERAVLHGVAGARAGQTPAQKCSVAKSKAAAKKIEAKLKCQQRAVQEGTAVDPACLTTAETKFD